MKKISAVPILLATGILFAMAVGPDDLRGDRVGWARLHTPSPWWNRHAQGDPIPIKFLRANSSLNIEPNWQEADVEDLRAMCRYPFLFTQEIDSVRSATGRTNLVEYLRRGGFLMIDTCINANINPDPDACFRRQIRTLAEILPEAKIVPLPPDHSVYHCYFDFPAGKPPHTFRDNVFDERWDKHGLYGIQLGKRLAGVISMSGLQCGWARDRVPPGHGELCMKMLVNIYVHAMMQPN